MSEIIKAVWRNDIAYLEQNLNSSNVDERDSDKRTALFHACIDNKIDVVKLLLKHEADVNLADYVKWTPLFYAVQKNLKELVMLLLQNNAFVNQIDIHGNTPLGKAVYEYDGDLAIVKMLLKAGADKNSVNNHGVSIWKLANTIAYPKGKDRLLELLK